jgi:arylsulfatase A-like enzyme
LLLRAGSRSDAWHSLFPDFTMRLSHLLVLALLPALGPAAERKPNILFILTDDQGWPTLSCYGGKLVPTPHLDRLAAEGARFTDAYVTPQCTPTRAALLTGQHSARNRMWHVIPWYGTPYAWLREPEFREQLSRDTFTLAKGLRAAGYATGMAGKWHLTTNADGDYTALKAEAAAYYGFDYAAPPGPGSQNAGDKHVDYLTDRALEFIARERQRPWFFYLAHHTVHGVVSAPAPLVAKYRARGAPETGLHNATYVAAIEHLDNSIGRLMAGLDELGQREHTLVVFLSDNGGVDVVYDAKGFAEALGAKPPTPTQLTVERREFSNAPLRMGKGSHYEGGIRVPCLVRWPGVIRPQTVSATPIHVVDWVPTLIGAAGGRAPDDHVIDGTNLLPLFRGEPLPARPLFWYLPFYELRWGATPSAIVREGDWKLIEFFGDWFDPGGRYMRGGRLELYNLRDDIGEHHDLASRDAPRAKALQAKLHTWLASVPAEVPGRNPAYDEPRQFLEVRNKPLDRQR